jgi:hypothetical protein
MIEERDERIKYALTLEQRLKQSKDYRARICEGNDVSVEELLMGSRRRCICELRTRIAHHFETDFGLPLAEAPRQFGVSTSAISRAIKPATEK